MSVWSGVWRCRNCGARVTPKQSRPLVCGNCGEKKLFHHRALDTPLSYAPRLKPPTSIGCFKCGVDDETLTHLDWWEYSASVSACITHVDLKQTCCSSCKKWFAGKGTHCPWCLKNTSGCLGCGRWITNDIRLEHGGYCPPCFGVNVITGYSTRTEKRIGFYPSPPEDEPYFGIEIEVQARDSKRNEVSVSVGARALLKAAPIDWLLLKHDASLGEQAFEIVSAPASLSTHRKQWEFLKEFKARKYNLRSFGQKACGTHVHFSRYVYKKVRKEEIIYGRVGKRHVVTTDWVQEPYVSNLTLGKMSFFITHNQEFTRWIAQRTSGRYNGYDQPNRPSQVPTSRGGLYVGNDNTIELRIFAGNLRYEAVMKNLEFAAALVGFCKNASLQHLAPKFFFDFVEGRRYEWPHLWLYLKRLEKHPEILTSLPLLVARKRAAPKGKEKMDKVWKKEFTFVETNPSMGETPAEGESAPIPDDIPF